MSDVKGNDKLQDLELSGNKNSFKFTPFSCIVWMKFKSLNVASVFPVQTFLVVFPLLPLGLYGNFWNEDWIFYPVYKNKILNMVWKYSFCYVAYEIKKYKHILRHKVGRPPCRAYFM